MTAPTGRQLRERATVVVSRAGSVLLVRDVDPGEPPAVAAERELLEETGLSATRTESLFVLETAVNRHHVFLVEADGDVEMGHEISEFRWWDRREPIPTHPHVESILGRL